MKLKLKISNVLLLMLILISISATSFAQLNKKLLIGKWLFVTFTLPNQSKTNDEYLLENNTKYKDVTYVFTKDEFLMQKKNGGENWNKKTKYKLLQDKFIKLYIGQKTQTMRIDYLDVHTLKIFVEGSEPTGIFKRIE